MKIFKKNKQNMDIREKLLKYEKKDYRESVIEWIPRSPKLLFVLSVFVATDCMVLYQLIEAYHTQNQLISIIMALATALVIDFIPAMLAAILNMPHLEKRHYINSVLLLSILVAVFATIFAVRWNSQDILYSISSTALQSQTGTISTVSDTNTAGMTTMTILLGILPIGTSALSFAVSLYDNKKEKKEYLNNVKEIDIKNELINIEVNNLEIKHELEQRDHIGYNHKIAELELNNIAQQEIIAKEMVKIMMALKVGNPQALTNLMETKN